MVTDRLQTVELRHELAPRILAEIAKDPAEATESEIEQVISRILDETSSAATTTKQFADDAVRAVREQLEHVAREAKVAESRLAIAQKVAGKAAWETTDLSGATDPIIEWLKAIEELLPARVAADRAAAAASARSASVDRRISARRRHPDIADLLNPPTAEGWGINDEAVDPDNAM